MKLLAVLCLVVAVTAAPQGPYSDVLILKSDYELSSDGSGAYKYEFEQSDNFQREEVGEIRNGGRDDEYFAVKGSYSYVGSDGVDYKVNYVADDNGFQPHLEQGPGGAIPPAVIDSLSG